MSAARIRPIATTCAAARAAGAQAWRAGRPAIGLSRDRGGRCVVAFDPRVCECDSRRAPEIGALMWIMGRGGWHRRELAPGPNFWRDVGEASKRTDQLRHAPNAHVASRAGDIELGGP